VAALDEYTFEAAPATCLELSDRPAPARRPAAACAVDDAHAFFISPMPGVDDFLVFSSAGMQRDEIGAPEQFARSTFSDADSWRFRRQERIECDHLHRRPSARSATIDPNCRSDQPASCLLISTP